MTRMRSLILAGAAAFAATAAYGHGNGSEGEGSAVGHPGDPTKVARTVNVTMTDAMRFSPTAIAVKKGETVRFVVHNEGKLVHEMVLGTDGDLRQHAALMQRFPEMEHDDPNMVQAQPGTQAEMVWTFDKAGRFGFACLVPGHFEAGMKGNVEVK